MEPSYIDTSRLGSRLNRFVRCPKDHINISILPTYVQVLRHETRGFEKPWFVGSSSLCGLLGATTLAFPEAPVGSPGWNQGSNTRYGMVLGASFHKGGRQKQPPRPLGLWCSECWPKGPQLGVREISSVQAPSQGVLNPDHKIHDKQIKQHMYMLYIM